ncbi:MAG TPA: FtsX-like permease family protein, partial [Terriglobales bacterium]
ATLLAYAFRDSLVWFYPTSFVRYNLEGHLDWRVLFITAVIGVLTTLLFAAVPALQSSKVDLSGALKAESSGVVGGSRRAWLRAALVVVQVSFTFMLLVGIGLILKSMQRIATASPGFSTDDVLITDVDLISAGYDKIRSMDFQQRLIDRVRSLPGVKSAALGKVQPFSYSPFFTGTLEVVGYQPSANERPTIDYNKVGPQYFSTLGIPLLAGREFTDADNEKSGLVTIVNQRFVDQYLRGSDPLGKSVKVKDRWLRIVGVAQTSRYDTLTEPPKPFLYVPYLQDFAINVGLDIRTSRDAASMASTLAKEIHAIDPNVSPLEVVTMRRHVNRSALAVQQVVVSLLGIFGTLALLMASIGLYGVMSYLVSQRTRDLGLRVALGATPTQLMRLVMSNGLMLTLLGLGVGAITTLAIVQRLGTLLYKTSPFDPSAYGVALLVMLAAGVAACLVPAVRATRKDPVQALRS